MTGLEQTLKTKVFVYQKAVLIILNPENLKCTELTSFSAGDDTVIITWPWAMPSQDAAFFATEMEIAKYPDQGHKTGE